MKAHVGVGEIGWTRPQVLLDLRLAAGSAFVEHRQRLFGRDDVPGLGAADDGDRVDDSLPVAGRRRVGGRGQRQRQGDGEGHRGLGQ